MSVSTDASPVLWTRCGRCGGRYFIGPWGEYNCGCGFGHIYVDREGLAITTRIIVVDGIPDDEFIPAPALSARVDTAFGIYGMDKRLCSDCAGNGDYLNGEGICPVCSGVGVIDRNGVEEDA